MTLEALKQAIAELPAEERAALATWLHAQQAEEWDRQTQKDFAPGGPGIRLVKKAKPDIPGGKVRPVDETRT